MWLGSFFQDRMPSTLRALWYFGSQAPQFHNLERRGMFFCKEPNAGQ
jgi:hypothetical protein